MRQLKRYLAELECDKSMINVATQRRKRNKIDELSEEKKENEKNHSKMAGKAFEMTNEWVFM
jgi:hypothetical protein